MNKFFISMVLVSDLLLAKNFTGIISPQYDLNLSLSTDGIVKEIVKKEGGLVKKEDPILILDNKLQNLETQRRKIIWQDTSKLNNLIQQKKVIQKRYDDALDLYNQTKSISFDEITSTKLKLDEIESEIKFNSENEKREELEYTISKEMLDNGILKSPIDGVVTKISVDIGEWVKTGEYIVNVINSKICYVEFNIEKDYLAQIKNKKSLTVTIDEKSNKIQKEAKIEFISPIADRSSGLTLVKVQIDNTDNSITPGLTAILSFDDSIDNSSIVNPASANIKNDNSKDEIIKSMRPLN